MGEGRCVCMCVGGGGGLSCPFTISIISVNHGVLVC